MRGAFSADVMTLAEVRSEVAFERHEGARAADGLHPFPRRILEVVPPALAWVALTSPIWAAIVAPQLLGFFLVAFAAYWFWRSAEFAAGLLFGLRRMHLAQRRDWLAD